MENCNFLSEQALRYWLVRIGAREDMSEVLCAAARRIAADRRLKELFLAEQQLHGELNQWHRSWDPLPMDEAVTQAMPEPSQFYYLSYLSALPWALRRYHEMGIPEQVFDRTMAQLPFMFLEKHDAAGRWVYTGFGWIWRHLSAELFRLGRMQYMAIQYPRAERLFRHKNGGELVMLCDPDLDLRGDGWANGAGGRFDTPWRGAFAETADAWAGNPLSREGYVLKETVMLPKSQWELVLEKGDWVLDLHIPKDGPFTPDECRASIAMAEQFYQAHFPRIRPKGLYCHTWLFTAQLKELLPAGSNILAFQDEFYRMPTAGSASFLWSFVFGEGVTRDTAPRDTSLRRSVLGHLDRGGELFDLCGIALQDSASWGKALRHDGSSIR